MIIHSIAWAFECSDINYSSSEIQHRIKSDKTIIFYINQSQVQQLKKNSKDDQFNSKLILRQSFYKYYQNKLNWNYLEIETEGIIFGSKSCNKIIYFFMEGLLDNIIVKKISRDDAITNNSMNEISEFNESSTLLNQFK